MDTKRLILFVIFSFSILMLWDSWQKQHSPQTATVAQTNNESVPSAQVNNEAKVADAPSVNESFKLETGKRIHVETDFFKAEIDSTGGDLRHLELLQHKESGNTDKNFVLMDDGASPMLYVAQTGLKGADLPTHKVQFTSTADTYKLDTGKNDLEVKLSTTTPSGIQVDKTYVFHRGSYVIDVAYQIHNGSSTVISPAVYYQILHDSESNQGSKMMPTFTGGAYYTDADKYKKLNFSEMAKEDLGKSTTDGWIGLVQHYFVGAWVQKQGQSRKLYTAKISDKIYSVGSLSALGEVSPGADVKVSSQFYAGPQTQSILKTVAPGLELTVDYGWLKVIATPLFWVLSAIHSVVNNWGVAIILLTVLIKMLFYPLSAKSYRSMAQMRELAPRLQAMKEKFGEDKQKMQQAMMELYKTEKINPLGGCLPILVQVPVFISLYWMLQGSVEMRHAPFFGWITDLSAPDTLFGTLPFINMPIGLLPLLMGASMVVQTKLNPKPTDPVQAQVMQIMPLIFSVFFFFFPAGLVLYWLVNNILSIAQQWRINQVIHRESLAKKKGNASR
jgi:YidC/Oxa1 family membrane protein insertase